MQVSMLSRDWLIDICGRVIDPDVDPKSELLDNFHFRTVIAKHNPLDPFLNRIIDFVLVLRCVWSRSHANGPMACLADTPQEQDPEILVSRERAIKINCYNHVISQEVA